MRNSVFCFVLVWMGSQLCSAQGIPSVPEGKSVVYFVRTSSLGFANSFMYFDSTKLIGKFNAPKYMRYECEPGHHLFWAKSENVAFVKATLDVGKVYFIYVDADTGTEKPLVKLQPVAPSNRDVLARIFKLMNKKSPAVMDPEDLADENKAHKADIKKVIAQYNGAKEDDAALLSSDMFYPLK